MTQVQMEKGEPQEKAQEQIQDQSTRELLGIVLARLLAKLKPPNWTDSKAEKEKLYEQTTKRHGEGGRSKLVSDNCIQVCAWVLLTLGLCILATTFYLAINKQEPDNSQDFFFPEQGELGTYLEFNKSVRTMSTSALGTISLNFEGCRETLCKVVCNQAEDIFEAIHLTMSNSSCLSTDFLLIENQNFSGDVLGNSWYRTWRPVFELFIVGSDLAVVESGAFDTTQFASTFLMTWFKLHLRRVESGALLGLYSLRYLTIDGQIDVLEPAFFQPVQTTLTHLKLNAGLLIQSNATVFGVSQLRRLQYLDLSRNFFGGPLTKDLFLATPNLKVLVITNAQLTSIEDDAFAPLVGRLSLLNLSRNLLTTMSADVLAPLLTASSLSIVSLGDNIWTCDCDLRSLVETYAAHRSRFMDPLYCKAPHSLYGTLINELDFEQTGCSGGGSTVAPTVDQKDEAPGSTTVPSSSGDRLSTDSQSLEGSEESVFQMRCTNTIEAAASVDADARSISLSSSLSTGLEISSGTSSNLQAQADLVGSVIGSGSGSGLGSSEALPFGYLEYIHFEPPSHEFELQLFDNRSVLVTVDDVDPEQPVNIIWFSEAETEDFDLTYAGESIDYNCVGYTAPFIVIDELVENTTYTFCLVPSYEATITPFNCLPLHVPYRQPEDNVWISADDKQFTVGILCLIFLVSAFCGAVIAYFGIKTYPDLLEGSKNVLVVKKSDQTCYVSTICEGEFLKNSSIKKRPLGASLKKNAKETSSPLPPAAPFCISTKHLERLYSTKSSSTCFDEPFVPLPSPPPPPPPPPFVEDEYEMPKPLERGCDPELHSVPNMYAVSPCSPPPLPKRNSTVSENVYLVTDRSFKTD